MAPLISHIYELGLMTAVAIPQTECFEAAMKFVRTEGIVPAPEPTHAIAVAVWECVCKICRHLCGVHGCVISVTSLSGAARVGVCALCPSLSLCVGAYVSVCARACVNVCVRARA